MNSQKATFFEALSTQALPFIPDNLTIPQFILDTHSHPSRPIRPSDSPWFIHNETGKRIGFEEVRTRTYGLANAFSDQYHIGNNEVVVLFSRNHVDWPIALWALHRLGAVVSPANPDYSSSELVYQLQLTKATTIIVHPDNVSTALQAAKEVGLSPDRILILGSKRVTGFKSTEDLIQHGLKSEQKFIEPVLKPGESKTKLALLSFSSGTTGKPKAVAIPHYALIANVIQVAQHNRINEDYVPWEDKRFRVGDVALAVLPFYHIYGLVVNMHFLLFAGMSIVPVEQKFNFEEFLKSVVRHKVTHLLIVPPQAVLLCKHPIIRNYDLKSTVRAIMTGAAPLSEEVNHQLFQLFPTAHVGQGYGMTESCTVTSMWPIEKKRGTSGSSGSIIPGATFRILKPDGSFGTYDEIGELVVKAPSLALGYFGNRAATEETFVDGWLRTGDQAKIDKNHEVWIVDRLKEILKVKGFQVAPAELEGCMLDHPDVSDVCVVGIADEYSGELPLAFVLPSAEAQAKLEKDPSLVPIIKASIMDHVAKNKISYKHLAVVEFVDLIPKNPSGKLLRRVLRDKAKALVESGKVKIGRRDAKL